ncbi:hypothetical protein ACFLZ6_00265 [Nanoarchaeota archaeon]
MRLKRVIKKIAALSVGATMVGATVLGAMAADLGDYPSPLFIKDGKFSGILVVGDKADAKDIIGITDVMGSLQYAATKAVTGGATTTASISEGVKIDKNSEHLNMEESFYDVMTTGIDSDDLPDILTDGTYEESEGNNKNDIEYEQELLFVDGTNTLTFHQDDDDAAEAGDYLYIAKSTPAYSYILDFDDDLEYDNSSESNAGDDWETTVLSIQGNTYTITDVKLSGGALDKIYMQAGETTIWLEEGVTLMRTIGDVEHEIVLVDVNDDATKCGVSVDGTTQWVSTSSSKTINGIEVGVTDAIVIHSATQDTDTCQVNLGAVELMLENGDEVEQGGEDIDGSNVAFTETSGGLLSKINLTYTPEDKIYVPVGGNWVDPVFGNFEYNYAGLTTAGVEEIEVTASSDEAEAIILNNDGKEMKIPFFYNGSEVILGTSNDVDEQFYVDNATIYNSDVTNLEGIQILRVLSNGEAHIIELKDIDTSNNKVTFKDVTYGGEKTSDYTDGVSGSAELPEGTLTITINELANLSFSGVNQYASTSTGANFETSSEAEVDIVEDATVDVHNVIIYENPDGSNDDGTDTQTTISVNLTYDSTDEEIDIKTPTIPGADFAGWKDMSDSNNDDKIAMTYFGTYLVHDDENKRSVDIKYPSDEVYGNGFVSKVGADVTTTTSGGESVMIQRIEVGATKLASEVSDVKAQNAILVGGPCANSAAADALGNPADCAAGFEEGKGLLQVVEFANGNVAMIVAGYSADDTRNVATVVANYKDYALSGTKMEVSKVGASITVADAME